MKSTIRNVFPSGLLRLAAGAAAFLAAIAAIPAAHAASVTVSPAQVAGSSPFIKFLSLTISPDPSALRYISVRIAPMAGSQTRAVAALYSANYLNGGNFRSHSYITGNTITLPVFGLYDNYTNTVLVTTGFTDGTYQQNTVSVPTTQFTETNAFRTPTVNQARRVNTTLSYDYVYVKSSSYGRTPIIIDTDGRIRFVGDTQTAFSTGFFDNGCYNSDGGSGLRRYDFDGVATVVKNYSGVNLNYTGVNGTGANNFATGTITSTNHHNFDPGKTGLLLECNTTALTESVAIEVDKSGNILHSWNFAGTISAAMQAGGDNPASFVKTGGADWFHNNSITYRPSDDTLVVSSRENFVMGIEYTTGALKWILGDSSKYWHTFPSLAAYSLALQPTNLPPIAPATTSPVTLPPIGQHGLSVYRDQLSLYDDDYQSVNQPTSGGQHLHAGSPYTAARKYIIDAVGKTATEQWNFSYNFSKYSNVCGSAYEDRSLNYLVCYATLTNLVGVDSTGAIAFDYSYPGGCGVAFNATPIHFENMRFQ